MIFIVVIFLTLIIFLWNFIAGNLNGMDTEQTTATCKLCFHHNNRELSTIICTLPVINPTLMYVDTSLSFTPVTAPDYCCYPMINHLLYLDRVDLLQDDVSVRWLMQAGF